MLDANHAEHIILAFRRYISVVLDKPRRITYKSIFKKNRKPAVQRRRQMGRFLIAMGLFFSLVSVSTPSEAYLRKGLFRLGLESTLFRFSVGDYDFKNGPAHDVENIAFGVGVPKAGLHLAGTVVNGLVFGGRITIGMTSEDQLFEDDQYFTWSVLPYLEYVFLRRVFRPFVTVMAGVEGIARYPQDDTWWWGFEAAGGGGFHFFVFQNLSIDLTFLAGGIFGGGREQNVEFQHWRFFTSMLFGISGWFG